MSSNNPPIRPYEYVTVLQPAAATGTGIRITVRRMIETIEREIAKQVGADSVLVTVRKEAANISFAPAFQPLEIFHPVYLRLLAEQITEALWAQMKTTEED